ncbi:hypothetical protein OS493_020163 [Desmophyllum pertusum]|uniref:Uncharacterized protein n=1 Tax=Desmophyllum pertusum TaxID=174260 RepID=A0A9X0D961_9CNID|nr:hypothetical protein OS493_020163 [Desmophyllum pertusum]
MIDASWQIEEPMEIGKLNGRRLYVGGTEGIATIAESLEPTKNGGAMADYGGVMAELISQYNCLKP